MRNTQIFEYLKFLEKYPDYTGFKRFCNICGFRFSKFLRFGDVPREARCPVCDSLERHRHLYIHLQALWPQWVENKETVLHFAPEPVIRRLFQASDIAYLDADIQPGRASLREDITAISLPDASVACVIAIHVLEHIVEDRKAMREIYRVLQPGGLALLDVPTRPDDRTLEVEGVSSPEERLRLYGQADHVRYYGLTDFCDRLRAAGFTLTLSRAENFPEVFREETLLGDKIVLARKPAL
jgi:SAM-dependent methyltransferase